MAFLMASTRLASGMAFRSAATRPVAARPAIATVARNLSSTSGFLAGSSFARGLAAPAPSRGSLVVLAAGGKSMACTVEGTRRKRRRTSGFRARMRTKAGKKVIKTRRDRGRHSLAPASERASGGKKK